MASERNHGPRSDSGGDARTSLALWLRAGRAHRGMSLEHVAKVTKIQPRILERLEAGQLEGLPAEVFVRGFVRSFARCVGLDEGEALRRYTACAIGTQDLTPTVRALVDAMADLAPGSAVAARATPRKMTAVEVIDVAGVEAVGSSPSIATPVATAIEVAPAAVQNGNHQSSHKKKRGRRRKARQQAVVSPAAMAVASTTTTIITEIEPAACTAGDASEPDAASDAIQAASAAPGEAAVLQVPAIDTPPPPPPSDTADEPAEAATPWAPKMPPLAAAPTVPWRRPAARMAAAMPTAPSLVIDDADPESAERMLEARAETTVPRRSLLPPILLDREDRSARQGGLTLAVILLLIAATLTLSYLMRRPSASGDGMTLRETPSLRG
jgi:cytoskeletal protein RodZ